MRIGYRQALARMIPLSFTLFRAALRAQQRRSLLGYLWLFVPATVAAVTANYVQSRGLLNFVVPKMPYPVFVFAGTTLWQVFLDALNAPLTQLSNSRAIFTRLYFPHEGLILSGLWMALLNTVIRIGALFVLCAILGVDLTQNAWLMPLGIGALALLGLGFGLLLAPIGLLYDDIGRGLGMATALLFFVMPIAYPLAGTGWQALNPVLPLINTTRGWLIGTGSTAEVAVSLLLGTCLLVLSWLFYRVSQAHVLERLG